MFMIGSSSTGLAFSTAFLKSHRRGDLERHIRRIDVMIGAIVKRRFDIDHWITGEVAARHRFSNPLLHRRDIIPRDRAADDLVDEFKPAAMGQRFDFDPSIAKLAMSAGLFFLPSLGAGAAANGFFIGHLGRFEHHLGAIFAFQFLDDDFNMLLAHARQE